jgi:hypothetical protein
VVVTTFPGNALARANIRLVFPPPPTIATISPEGWREKALRSDQPET